MLKIVHFCAGLEQWNGMANTALQFVAEERVKGFDSQLTNDICAITSDVDQVVIHGAWLPVLWKVAKLAKRNGAKLYIRPAGSYDPVRLAYHGWKKRLVSPFEHRMLRRADVLLATCEAEKCWIQSYVGNPCPPILLTDLKRFFNLDKRSDLLSNLDFRSDLLSKLDFRSDLKSHLHLLYLGRRHPLKGLSYLEAAVRQLSSVPSSLFPVPPQLKVVSNAFGDELEKVWDWSDVLVLPTLSENFGRVVAEALERGKRVITTDGAPAWSPYASATEDKGDSNTYGGRLIYLKGYRDGTDEERVELLKKAIERICE